MAADNKDDKIKNQPESYLTPPAPPEAASGGKDGKTAKDGKGLFTGLRVSLMPEELQGKATASLRRLLLIMGLVLVVESAIVGTAWYLVKSYSDKQAAKLETLVSNVRTVQEENSMLEETASGVASFGPQIIASQAALDERLAWTPLFRYLESITLPTVQYLNFRADVNNGMLYLTCVSQSYRDAAEQITLYKNSEMIADAEVSSVSATTDEDGAFLGVGFSANLTMVDSTWSAAQLFDVEGNPVIDEVTAEEETGAIKIPVLGEANDDESETDADNLE
jgi:hypothetical protein